MVHQSTIQKRQQIGRASLAMFAAVYFANAATGQEVQPSELRPLVSCPAEASTGLVHVWSLGPRVDQPKQHFIICHGMWGMKDGDRFHQLADEIKSQFRGAEVLLFDWSDAAKAGVAGVPQPWMVARHVDSVAKESAALMEELGIDPNRSTFIGESFGNYVLAGVAKRLGGGKRLVALNPASELGGYHPPNLRECFDTAWTFHTNSAFDTRRDLGHRSLLLQTPEEAGQMGQHLFGVQWLAQCVASGNDDWLTQQVAIPEAKPDYFDGTVTMDGKFFSSPLPKRQRRRVDGEE